MSGSMAGPFRTFPGGIEMTMRPTPAHAFALLGALLCSSTCAFAATPVPAAKSIDAIVRKAHDAGQFDGIVVLDYGNGSGGYRTAIGDADRILQQKHRADEVWRWASITKQVTAVLAMQEVERGRLRLDGTLADYLPGFGDAAIARVTLKQLLQHTSGLANPDDTQADEKGVPAFYRDARASTPAKSAPRVCAEKPKRKPGERFEYNNCDYLVLGAILERLNNASYAQLVSQRIAKPLGMRTLALAQPGAARLPGPVIGYSAEGVRESPIDLGRYGAAGALHGSADDLLRFDRGLMSGKLIAHTTAATMWQGDAKLGFVALGAWSYTATLKHCSAPTALVERQGEIGGIRAVNVIAPDTGAALIAFSNTGATEWGQVWRGSGFLYDLLDAALCSPIPAAPAPKRTKR